MSSPFYSNPPPSHLHCVGLDCFSRKREQPISRLGAQYPLARSSKGRIRRHSMQRWMEGGGRWELGIIEIATRDRLIFMAVHARGRSRLWMDLTSFQLQPSSGRMLLTNWLSQCARSCIAPYCTSRVSCRAIAPSICCERWSDARIDLASERSRGICPLRHPR